MKQWMMFLVGAVTVVALSGCGGGGAYDAGYDDGYVDASVDAADDSVVTLFLADEFGIGMGDVPYECVDAYNEIVYSGFTPPNGEFTISVGDRCTFDLFGFDGSRAMPLYIVDIDGFGIDDVPYNCDNSVDFTDGVTDFDGWFAYPIDAYCKFYF